MRISHIKLENWKNFQSVNVDLTPRVFLAGPNASGKSNFLDVFRFLRDLADIGLQKAVNEKRGGVSKIRCYSARRYPNITIEVSILASESAEAREDWKYSISFNQDNLRRPKIVQEVVRRGETSLLQRPDKADKADPALLSQTALEQIAANKDFRDLADFFKTISYRHLVPQIIKNPQDYQMTKTEKDPFGRDFLEQISATPDKTQKSRLSKITAALRIAVPQLDSLEIAKDYRGIPHLQGRYSHGRGEPAKQLEDQFSDGTLRLLGLLWSLFEGDGPLLLEEPELSLHPGVVRHLAPLISRLQRQRKKASQRQVIISTHSVELLSDKGIGGEETLLLIPEREGTQVHVASAKADIKVLLDAGMSVAEAALPFTEPKNLPQLELFNGIS